MIAIACFAACLGQQQDQVAEASKLAVDYLKNTGVVGLSVAAVRDGKIVLSLAEGYADREKRKNVDANTLFRLGSISKPVTAVGLMKLVEKQKIDLDAPLGKYVPEWPNGRQTVNLRHLLSHTGGVRHYKVGTDWSGKVTRTYTTEEAAGLIAKDEMLFEPGTKESYSTHAYTLIARAIETASGESFVTYLRKSVFPADKQVDCEVLRDRKPLRSSLYTLVGKQARQETEREDNSWKYGGGGMEATASGLATWGDAVRAGKLVGPKALAEMWTPAKLNDGKVLGYGLGWGVRGQVVSHTGAQQGCRSWMTIDRAKKLTIVVLTNTGGNHSPGQLGAALGKLLDPEPTNRIEAASLQIR